MKKITLLSLCLSSLFLFNCSSDSDDTTPVKENEKAVNNNQQEDIPLEITSLEKGISIEDATFVKGAIPTPNEKTSFTLESNKQSGYLNKGVEFEIKAPDNYAGAYIQLKSTDGNIKSNGYFNVAYNNDIPTPTLSPKTLFSASKVLVDEPANEIELEIEFDETVKPGTFCYEICVYDADGNISAPQTVCVTIEAWGGNNSLIGNWKLTKEVDNENGEIMTTLLGEEHCENRNEEISCKNMEILKIPSFYCDTVNELILTIASDGTQKIFNDSTSRNLNYDESTSKCETIYNTSNSIVNNSGNWAFNEEENVLTIVNFDSEVITDGKLDVEDSEDNIGIGFEINVKELTSNNLILEEVDTYTSTDINGQKITKTEIYTYYFTK